MTDFDQRIHRGEEPRPIVPGADPDELGPRRAPGPERRAVPAREQVHEAARETEEDVLGVGPRLDRGATDEARAAQTERSGARTGEPVPEPDPAGGPRAEDERRARTRRRVLTGVLAGLARSPEDAPLASLFTTYADATEAEVAHAAGSILTLYLRAGTETRRRLRPVLAVALRRAERTSLAHALVARLGAIALPRPAPPRPPTPPPPGPPSRTGRGPARTHDEEGP